MGLSTDIVEAVPAVGCCLSPVVCRLSPVECLAGFVREICPGMHTETSKLILM